MNTHHEDVFAWLTGRQADRAPRPESIETREAWQEHGFDGNHGASDEDDSSGVTPEAVTHTRRNVADMTAADVRRLQAALGSINTAANPAWGRFVILHRVLGTIVHGAAGRRFLPWHRLMVWHFERLLRSTAEGGSVYLPYWTWWQEPTSGRRAIPAAWVDFRPNIVLPTLADMDFVRALGGLLASDVRAALGSVAGGSIGLIDMINLLIASFLDPSGASMLGTAIPVTRIDRARLLRGDTSAAGRSLPDRTRTQGVLGRTSFWDFSNALEGLHGNPHMWIGDNGRPDGRMADIELSPADPLFFFHHAEVDRLWHLWQTTAARRAPWTVTGAELPPWSQTIAQMMSIGAAPLEFAYESLPIDDPNRTP